MHFSSSPSRLILADLLLAYAQLDVYFFSLLFGFR